MSQLTDQKFEFSIFCGPLVYENSASINRVVDILFFLVGVVSCFFSQLRVEIRVSGVSDH